MASYGALRNIRHRCLLELKPKALELSIQLALFRFRMGVMKVLAACAAAGVLLRLAGIGS